MLYRNIELHNVSEITKAAGGIAFYRFPLDVCNNLGHKEHKRGRFISKVSTGCEIRFVTDGPVRIKIMPLNEDGRISIWQGDYYNSAVDIKKGTWASVLIDKNPRFDVIDDVNVPSKRFNYKVWRIAFDSRAEWIYGGIDNMGSDVRPPAADEKPSIKWLAYGSSITHGAGAVNHHNSYVQRAAIEMGIDVFGCGLGGACLCERVMAEHLSKRGDWDFITMELGINMRGMFTPDEFKERAYYLIDKILTENPGKPVVMITTYPNFADIMEDKNDIAAVRDSAFREILKKKYNNTGNQDLYIIDGDKVLTNFTALSGDLVHPADTGHIEMGHNLADMLKAMLHMKYFD